MPDYGFTQVNYTFLYPFCETYQSSLNATTVAELRVMTTDELLDGTGVSAFGADFDPVLDGWAIPTTYEGGLLEGPASDVPVIAGNNHDEDSVMFSENYTAAEYETALESYYNTTWAGIFFNLYPPNTTAKATTAYKAQLRDGAQVSTWSWASAWAKTAKSPVFAYESNYVPPGQDQGAYYGSEISYVLNSLCCYHDNLGRR
jgi:carboxylesterase 2